MENKSLDKYTAEDINNFLNENVDAIVVVDRKTEKYRSITRKGIFTQVLDEEGDYADLIQKLWFHRSDSTEEISDDYKAFIDYYGEFKGKYSRRIKIFPEGKTTPSVVQMNVYPLPEIDKYVFIVNILDDEEYVDEYLTAKKVKTIQNTYLFSMFVNLVTDTTSSISVTEISDEPVKTSLDYSKWRLMTVNMIYPDSQKQFLEFTDPENLKNNLSPGNTISFDCLMKNLEGVFIWVKLIFSRATPITDEDYRYVFMVQNIHEDVIERMNTIKKYERLAHLDPLTGLLNHGGIQSEIQKTIDSYDNAKEPVALMMMDLDDFKNINDTYGHSVGDATLKSMAELLKDSVDDKKACVGRWGGEEFVIILKGASSDGELSLAEHIRKTVAENVFGQAGHLTCSIGVSRLNSQDSMEDIFDRIDKAMYTSKKIGKNKVTIL